MPLSGFHGNCSLPFQPAGCGFRRNAKYWYPGTSDERESRAMPSRGLAGSLNPGHEDTWVVLRNCGHDCICGVSVFHHATDRHILGWTNSELS